MKPELHIAGIGASAGGLEAMLPMFARMPATGRITYVVAQHMAKDGHDALVTRLIGRESALPVLLASEGMRLQPDTVYIIPSGKNAVLDVTTLHLTEPTGEHLSTPSVNALFESIAREAGRNGIGIVLSGTGTDGSNGCRAIKAAGGLTLAQDPLEAKFDGMPTAAAGTHRVDQVLAVGRMGELLATLFPGTPSAPVMKAPIPAATPGMPTRASSIDPVALSGAASESGSPELAQLLRQVLKATGIDFSSYKEDTLLRRLEKRKDTLGITSAEHYLAYIKAHPEELNNLQHLFLVSVSSFFRDHESFQVLKMSLARLLAGKPPTGPNAAVRVWVPGCASGEEPLTLAILLKEMAGERPLEIIATDLNPEALALSRDGTYRQTAFKEMEPVLRERYSSPKGQHFTVQPELLACIRYEQRDVLGGAPARDLDLVSCRNLLIYMKSHLQDQLIKCFHAALRPEGLLFIGQSESLSFIGNSLFSPIDHYHRLFRRRH